MFASWINGKNNCFIKFSIMWFSVQMQQKRKMTHFWKEQTQAIENGLFATMEWKRSWRWLITVNHSRSWSASKEGDVAYLAWLEGHCLLRSQFRISNVEFRQVLFPVRLIKGSSQWKASKIGQSEEYCLPSEQCQASCLYTDPVGIDTTTATTVLSCTCTFALPLILISTKFS